MNSLPSQTISTFMWRSVAPAIILSALLGLLLSFVHGFVRHYQEKHQHIEQLAELVTMSASTADGTTIVAEQVAYLLENEPSIHSILFYSTPKPIDEVNQSKDDWKNALFANTVSFNYPVISHYINDSRLNNSDVIQEAVIKTDVIKKDVIKNNPTTNQRLATTQSIEQADNNSDLVGYINITLDVNELRLQWLQRSLLLWFIALILAFALALYILRKLKWLVNDIEALAEVCYLVAKNKELEQLPVIPQRFDFQELVQIKQTFIMLFNRLQEVRQDYEELAVFEQQLHSKDLSLDVQLHNFQSMITHELKTSLNAIVGGLQLLDYDHLTREQKDAVEIIQDGSDKLVLSLEQIIQLNQIQKGQISINRIEFNPLQLIADMLAEFEPIAQRKGLELVSHIHHIDYRLAGDVEKIQQILSILLSNAIKFTPVGKVMITSQLTHFDQSNRWQIGIEDTGIGIDSNHISDIFNPFFQVDSSQTRQYEGSGVGLPIVKKMAQLMDATIEVDSTLGRGTKFTLIIPMANQQQKRQQHLLAGLTVIYYYYHEVGALGKEIERLGATIIYCQHEQLAMDKMQTQTVNMVMFAEDVFPNKAESVAKHIRQLESAGNGHRALLVYWYPQYQAQYLDSFEHGLKSAGIDYCYSANYKDKALSDLLKSWLVWT